MSEFTAEKQDQILAKVRKLLERAEHPRTPSAEADSSRAMAESLMLKYRISESLAVASGDTTIAPVWREIRLFAGTSEFATFYYQLAGVVASHIGARARTSWKEDEEGNIGVTLEWVGYFTDLSYGDMLLTACMMEFGKRLEPKYEPSLSDEENAWNLRSAGWERKRIAEVMLGAWETENEMKAKNRKITSLIKAWGEKSGEGSDHLLGRGNNVKTYRESYARGFVSTFSTRLSRMRTAQGEDYNTGAVVLVSRKENVDEAYYLKFPHLRPNSEKAWKDPSKECDKCKAAKSGYCREHGYLKPSTARSGPSVNMSAYRRGGSAAASVDLGPGAAGRGRMADGGPRKALD